eukprot:229164_1
MLNVALRSSVLHRNRHCYHRICVMSSESKSNQPKWQSQPPYISNDASFQPKYIGNCECGRVSIECSSDPLDVKICHCRGCQKLHGAPMQIACIFRKHHIRFTRNSLEWLKFYSADNQINEHVLPCKLSCIYCNTMIADEGRNMFLAFPSIFNFKNNKTPDSFKPKCHIFYGQRVVDITDNLPKWMGHKQHSSQLWQNSFE